MERVLVAIWEDVLEVSPIGIDDDFLALGGDSRLAAELVRCVEKSLATRIPISVVFEAPTIAALAAAVTLQESIPGMAGVSVFHRDGALPPVFGLPGMGGMLGHAFRRIASELGEDQPIYALKPQGVDEGTTPHETIEEMAAFQIQKMRRIQPHGPYQLLGYSLGGRVAFAAAQQLAVAGEEVSLLAMIDSAAPGYPSVDRASARLIRHARQALRAGGPISAARYLFHRIRRRASRTRERTVPRAAPSETKPHSLESRVAAVRQANLRASAAYEPLCHTGNLVLFRAVERPEWLGTSQDDPENGWGRFIDGVIELHQVPGDHMTLFEPPNVRTLVDALSLYLGGR